MSAFPDAIKQDWEGEIRGFGTSPQKGAVYIIPKFELDDGNEKYRIINLLIAVCYRPSIGYDFVMSDTMFAKTDTTIRRMRGKQLIIEYEKEEYRCAVKRAGGTFSIVTFSQEETHER